jgi:hypothetical protein
MRTQAVVILERLVDPRVVRQIFQVIVRLEGRGAFHPDHGRAHFGDVGVVLGQVLAHLLQGHAGIGQVVDQQDAAGQRALGHRHVLGDVQVALLGAGFFAVGAGRQDRQRHVEDARDHVARTHAAARQAQHHVEFPVRFVDLERGALQQLIIVETSPSRKVLAIFIRRLAVVRTGRMSVT